MTTSVELFVRHGAKVAIADMDEARGQELADSLCKDLFFQKTDVSQEDQVQALVDRTIKDFGGLHMMFNNAGIGDGLPKDFLTADFSNFDRVAIAEAAVFLGSDRSAQITGLIVPVDAGTTAGDPISQIQEILDARAAAMKG